MSTSGSRIALRDQVLARSFQFAYPALERTFHRAPQLEFATKRIARPRAVMAPTRHGYVKVLVFSPTDADIATMRERGEKPPVHLILHGGAFVLRHPAEEGNVARFLASEVGCYVVVPDYLAAPQVRFPVAEDQSLDVFTWIHTSTDRGWDGRRITVGGPSAGGKLALSVALDAIESGGLRPLAVTTEYGVADLSRSNEERASAKKRPVVDPGLIGFVNRTYFRGADLHDPRVSPIFHPRLSEMPPTLVLTAEFDTLKQESNDLAVKLRALGVDVTHHEYAGVDHGFTHRKPVGTARAALAAIGDHLRSGFTRSSVD